MPTIRCAGRGCTSEFKTSEPLSPNAKYSCKSHTRPNKDEERFQKFQFDADLRRSGTPVGTAHIHNQGSDVLTAPDLATGREGENEDDDE